MGKFKIDITLLYILIAWVFCSPSLAQVQAPQLKCIVVGEDGSITLHWVPVSDPNGQFVDYILYHSVNNTNFVKIDSFANRLQDVHTIQGVGFPHPSLSNYRYYLVTKYFNGSNQYSLSSDTLTAIELKLTTSGNHSGSLSWNKPRDVPISTWFPNYTIDRKVLPSGAPPSSGVWESEIASPAFGNTSYQDNLVRCEADVYYRLNLEDSSGCVSRSNVVSAKLIDLNGAAPMTFDQISLNHDSGFVKLSWTKHPDGSVVSYIIIYIDSTGLAKALDTVNANTFDYRDYDPTWQRDPTERSQCYVIAALDSCGKTNGGGIKHCTVFLNHIVDTCKPEIKLEWSHYIGWAEVDSYLVYMREGASTSYVLMATVSGLDSSIIIKNLNRLHTYTFYVQARDNSGRFFSNSNLLGAAFDRKESPAYLKLRSADVLSDNSISLQVWLDRSKPTQFLNLYRSIDTSGPFKLVNSLRPPGGFTDSVFSIVDDDVHANQFAYTYYVDAMGTCNALMHRSNKFRSIFLKGSSSSYDMENNLDWSVNIDEIIEGEDIYQLYRGINKKESSELIRTLTYQLHEYTDDLSDFIRDGNSFCYQIQLELAANDSFNIAHTVHSNRWCVQFTSEVFVPSSFTPNYDTHNEFWKPVVVFVVPESGYHLSVFDRWGNTVFETVDPNEGWDGKFEGGEMPNGNYLYVLKIRDSGGAEIKKSGQLLLLR